MQVQEQFTQKALQKQIELEEILREQQEEAKSNKCRARYMLVLVLLMLVLLCMGGLYIWLQEQKIGELNSLVAQSQNESNEQTNQSQSDLGPPVDEVKEFTETEEQIESEKNWTEEENEPE